MNPELSKRARNLYVIASAIILRKKAKVAGPAKIGSYKLSPPRFPSRMGDAPKRDRLTVDVDDIFYHDSVHTHHATKRDFPAKKQLTFKAPWTIYARHAPWFFIRKAIEDESISIVVLPNKLAYVTVGFIVSKFIGIDPAGFFGAMERFT